MMIKLMRSLSQKQKVVHTPPSEERVAKCDSCRKLPWQVDDQRSELKNAELQIGELFNKVINERNLKLLVHHGRLVHINNHGQSWDGVLTQVFQCKDCKQLWNIGLMEEQCSTGTIKEVAFEDSRDNLAERKAWRSKVEATAGLEFFMGYLKTLPNRNP